MTRYFVRLLACMLSVATVVSISERAAALGPEVIQTLLDHPATLVAVTKLSDNWFVTATKSANALEHFQLGVTLWEYDVPNNRIIKHGSASGAFQIKNVAITSLARKQVVTAIRDSNGILQLDSWSVDINNPDIAPKHLHTAMGSGGTCVDIAALSGTEVVTAGCANSGKIAVRAWGVSSDGTISVDGIAAGGSATAAAITAVSPTQAVTATVHEGKLFIRAWKVDDGTVTLQPGGLAGSATTSNQVAIHPIVLGGDIVAVATSILALADILTLQDWLVAPDGKISYYAQILGSFVDDVALTSLHGNNVLGEWLFVADRGKDNTLNASTWNGGICTGCTLVPNPGGVAFGGVSTAQLSGRNTDVTTEDYVVTATPGTDALSIGVWHFCSLSCF